MSQRTPEALMEIKYNGEGGDPVDMTDCINPQCRVLTYTGDRCPACYGSAPAHQPSTVVYPGTANTGRITL